LCRNQETKERTSDATIAVVKLAISNPETNFETPQSRKTFIKKANIPNVMIVMGSAITCKIGRISVLTTPITMAATIAAWYPESTNPGTRYSTTNKAPTFIARRTSSFIYLSLPKEICLSNRYLRLSEKNFRS